jgi:tetratricopeptide (TPR) repeat protein
VIYKLMGRVDDAVAVARRAVDAGPKVMHPLSALADALRVQGRHEEAIEVLRRAIKIVPGHIQTLERLEWAFADLGDLDTAVDYRAIRLRQSAQAARADEMLRNVDALGAAEARRRDLRAEIDWLLKQTEEQPAFTDTPTTNSIGDRLALAYSQLGEWADAIAWIERGFAHRPGRLRRMLMDLPFDLKGLSTQPRFVRLLRLAGVEDLAS